MRSQFLTLLCILTFISCGLGLFDSVVSFFRTDAVAETSYVKRKLTPEEERNKPKQYFEDRAATGAQPMPGDPEEIRLLAIAQFFYSLLTLIGAILMFRLRRIGFWIYLAGVTVGIVLPVALAGFGALNTSFGVFFSLIFAGLYWLNLKDMH
ncbi:hypothetical protein [Spirosoma endbachense]|uniref:DUF4386 family protein n=1 Tax=Spirosoma endbachense TaxID=2666025 RepID=A0A6P1W4I3_9BACT|nr:hypothetical protein [Spirosoma endbachense]QHV98909.1 hypothetical protein GJR95_29595 [Spirosoma endbachense]